MKKLSLLLSLLLLSHSAFAGYNVTGDLYVSGNSGLGYATPTTKLYVSGNGYLSGNLGVGSLSPESSLDVSSNVHVGGNIGIGTFVSPQKLYVAGTAEMTGFKMNSGASAGYVLTSSSVGVGTWMPATTSSSVVNSGTTGQIAYYASSGTAVSGASTVITNGTNVGIGSSSPGVKLDVNGGGFAVRTTTSTWSLKTQSNQACNTTCGSSMCAFGEDSNATAGIVSCIDSTADRCVCMGP